MNCLIISGGTPPSRQILDRYIETADFIIGVDGAADLLLKLGIVPDILIGDFDTADPVCVKSLEEKGSLVYRLQAEKNETDTEAAIEQAVKTGAQDIVILGALGGRTDHTLSNIMMLVRADMAGVKCVIADEQCEMFVSNSTAHISGFPGQTISILPLTGEVCVNAQGLKYPLDNLMLRWGSSRGISNIMLSETASVSITGGYALIIKNKTNA